MRKYGFRPGGAIRTKTQGRYGREVNPRPYS